MNDDAATVPTTATAVGWPSMRTDRFLAVDATTPFPWQNCVVPLRPFGTDEVDDVIGEAEAFFREREGGPFLLWGGFPIPDLSARGWTLMGHPPLMLRPAGGEAPPLPDGLEIVPVRSVDDLEAYRIGIRCERGSHRFFKRYGERFEDSEGKRIFLEFAEEEREHLELLIREYRQLVKRHRTKGHKPRVKAKARRHPA